MQTHYFIALSLPTETKQHLKKQYEHIASTFPFKKPVHPLDYHITLAFLGAHEEESLRQLMANLKQAVSAVYTFPLKIDGYGIFGNAATPRIFWNRLQHEQALYDVQQIVANCCQEHGIELEARPYNPHITVARKWAGEKEFNSEALTEQNPLHNAPITFIANEIVLYRTNLTATPKYEEVVTIPLKNHEPL